MFFLILLINKITMKKNHRFKKHLKIISIFSIFITIFSVSSFFLTGCGKNVKKPVLPPDVYYKKAVYNTNNHKYSQATKDYKALIENYPTYRHTRAAELKLGDVYFLENKFIESEGAYLDFIHLHPRSKFVPFAMFFAAMSDYKRKENTGRNQMPLKHAESIFKKLISKYPYSKYSKKAFVYIGKIKLDLAKNEFFSGLYYYNASIWKPAAYMFKTVARKYPGTSVAPKALYYLAVCYEKLNKPKKEYFYKRILKEKYPQSRYAKMF